jgi:hypothetical protein
MIQLALAVLVYLRTFLRSRHDLGLEILVLRQRLAVFKRRRPQPHLKRLDPLLWVGAVLTLGSLDRWDRIPGCVCKPGIPVLPPGHFQQPFQRGFLRE